MPESTAWRNRVSSGVRCCTSRSGIILPGSERGGSRRPGTSGVPYFAPLPIRGHFSVLKGRLCGHGDFVAGPPMSFPQGVDAVLSTFSKLIQVRPRWTALNRFPCLGGCNLYVRGAGKVPACLCKDESLEVVVAPELNQSAMVHVPSRAWPPSGALVAHHFLSFPQQRFQPAYPDFGQLLPDL